MEKGDGVGKHYKWGLETLISTLQAQRKELYRRQTRKRKGRREKTQRKLKRVKQKLRKKRKSSQNKW